MHIARLAGAGYESGMTSPDPKTKRPFSRALFLILGLLSAGLGLLGAVLPILPTTPFMILALWCFARSSERFHGWLYHHRLFGPPLQLWEQHQVIPPIAKLAAVSAMVISMVTVTLFSATPWYGLAAMTVFLAAAAAYILTRPSRA